MIKTILGLLLCCALLRPPAEAASWNLATLSCDKYENEVLPAAASNPVADSINTVMWLFGFSVAKSGGHVMYPDALAPFGFALDNECKSNPDERLSTALGIVKPESKSPMDLREVPCSGFASRHVSLMQSDPESATTVMMWLFGYSTAESGSQIFDPDSIKAFETLLLAQCAKKPDAGLLDALIAVRTPAPNAAKRASSQAPAKLQ